MRQQLLLLDVLDVLDVRTTVGGFLADVFFLVVFCFLVSEDVFDKRRKHLRRIVFDNRKEGFLS